MWPFNRKTKAQMIKEENTSPFVALYPDKLVTEFPPKGDKPYQYVCNIQTGFYAYISDKD